MTKQPDHESRLQTLLQGVLKVDPQVVYLSDPHSGFGIVTAGSCQIVLVSTVRTV